MKRLGCSGALALFFLVAVIVASFAEGSAQERGGVMDASEYGHLALFALCEELGLEPGVFDGSPKQLAGLGERLVLLPWLPRELDEGSGLGSAFEPSWYTAFVEAGGDLVVPIASQEDLDFVCSELDMSEVARHIIMAALTEGLELEVPSAPGLEGDEQLSLACEPERPLDLGLLRKLPSGDEAWQVVDPDSADPPENQAAIVITAHGRGRLVLLGMPSAFENLHLPEADNALVFVRLLEALQARHESPVPLLFDQSVITRGEHRSWVAALFYPPLLAVTLSLLLALTIWAWSFSARRSFPLDRRLARRPAPAERARALAGLMQRAGHPEWLEARPEPQEDPNHD